MLMIRQIMRELKYSPKNKKEIANLLVGLLISFLFRNWNVTYIYIFSEMVYITKRRSLHNVPEIFCFLPMERKAREKYIKQKGYLVSGIMTFYMMGCLLITLIPYEEKPFNRTGFWYTLIVGIVVLIQSSERFVMSDNAKYRKITIAFYKKFCFPLWYRILDGFALVIKIGICLWVFLDVEKISFISLGQGWKLFISVMVFVMVVIHIIGMQYMIAMVDMGDYNAQGSEAEGFD